MRKFIKMKKGFTLVELLVVIAIIGVLAAAVLVSLAGTRPKARNAARKSDLQNVSRALQLFADASEDKLIGDATPLSVPDKLSYDLLGNGTAPDITPTYIQSLPTEPSSAINLYGYATFQMDGSTECGAGVNPGAGFDTVVADTLGCYRYTLTAWDEVANDTDGISVSQ